MNPCIYSSQAILDQKWIIFQYSFMMSNGALNLGPNFKNKYRCTIIHWIMDSDILLYKHKKNNSDIE